MAAEDVKEAQGGGTMEATGHVEQEGSAKSLFFSVFREYIVCFYMTSRRPYLCPKTMKRRPCWCPKPVLWELNSFLMQKLSFVPINLHRCWPREGKHRIDTDFAFFHLFGAQ